ncbi:PTS glucose transporter subunit IIA [Brevibacterium antiquum]|uniref:PTS sugar transporter subunit IIA n=1 Tax=Brevibacterium antiquum TaxID=234835 RepID=UPI0018DF0D36|nr:PTS glucose transporter subunit IIA [Brevibacterium antiquum]
MTLTISSPVNGTVIPLADVPDPVFAEALVGPGTAIDPGGSASVTALAPVSGTLTSLKPHAFVIVTEAGPGVLVHLGIDTVELAGDGFTMHAEAGQTVHTGDRLITWDTAPARTAGRSLVVPVIVLEGEAESLTVTEEGSVSAGDRLLEQA